MLLSLALSLAPQAMTQENYVPESWNLIQSGKFREALDRLVQAVAATPDNSKVYATLSLLYTKTEECDLAWKYFQIAQDLGYRGSDLERGVNSLCRKPKEENHEGVLEVDRSERGTLLTIDISPDQQQWPSRAKLPIIQPSQDRSYCELTVPQVRKLRKLVDRTVPWLILDKNAGWTVIIKNSDDWWTVVTEIK
ncbi:MAG: tetratricopeptide repeat protein [Candidatus Acidiferrales bacterium]